MHELGITDQLLQLTLRHAEQAGASSVIRLNLVIGELSSVVDESIRFYWLIMAKGTIAERAELHFERVPGRLSCQTCGGDIPYRDFAGQCPVCGSQAVCISDGDQFKLESIEVEGSQADGTGETHSG
jgi:hydrogenase nickel incorporation protein HypA/HybF